MDNTLQYPSSIRKCSSVEERLSFACRDKHNLDLALRLDRLDTFGTDDTYIKQSVGAFKFSESLLVCVHEY